MGLVWNWFDPLCPMPIHSASRNAEGSSFWIPNWSTFHTSQAWISQKLTTQNFSQKIVSSYPYYVQPKQLLLREYFGFLFVQDHNGNFYKTPNWRNQDLGKALHKSVTTFSRPPLCAKPWLLLLRERAVGPFCRAQASPNLHTNSQTLAKTHRSSMFGLQTQEARNNAL